MSTPQVQLETLFILNGAGRIVSTREPQATPGPRFVMARSLTTCAWAVRKDIPDDVVEKLKGLAEAEPPLSDFHADPVFARQYQALLGGHVHSGPAFVFPQAVAHPDEVSPIQDEQLLGRYFRGWVAGEIQAGRAPVMAVVDGGHPVSVCFSARRSHVAAEAGLETAIGFRGRGFAPRVSAAWALAVRASGQTPLYSTDWTNTASLAVARKLRLETYAVDWSLSD